MVKAAAAGYDVVLEEITQTGKHSMRNNSIYRLRKNNFHLHIGNYTNLIQLHKRLKNLLEYDFIDNKNDKEFALSYNSRYFYIKNKKTNAIIGIPNEYVRRLSADIGRFLYSKMIENKSVQKTSK